MTKTLIFSDNLVENPDTIFYNIVGNFIPPEWRNLTNNCGKRLSTTSRQLLSLIVSRLQFDNKRDRPVEELQESYLFFQQQLGVCQKRVKQCLEELKDSGLIDFHSTTLVVHNMRCPNIQCIKLLKKFVSFHKTNCQTNNYSSNQQEFSKQPKKNYSLWQNIQPNQQKNFGSTGKNFPVNRKEISSQPEKNFHSTGKIEKNFYPLHIIDNYLYNISISRYGKKNFFEENCGQSLAEIKSTEDQNLQSEATVSSVSKIPIVNYSDDCGENKKNCQQNWVEGKSTQEQILQLEAAVSSVSKISHLNSSKTSTISDSGSDSDYNSKDDDASRDGVNQQSCQTLASVMSKIVNKVKIPILNSSDDCEENKKNCQQNWVEGKSTQEQNFQSEAAVDSVSKIPHLNYSNTSPISDSGSDSDSDSKDDDTSSGGVNRQSCQKLASVISQVASKVKGWGFLQKLEEFHPLTEEDGSILRIRSKRDFNLNFINKLMIRLSEQRPNNRFRNKKAVLNYMTLALQEEMRPPASANNESFNFEMDDATRARESYLRKVEEDTRPTHRLQRKIAGVFEADTAYELLTNCSFLGVFGDAYRIKLAPDISLLEHEKTKLLHQVQELYGNKVQQLEIISKKTITTAETTADKSQSKYLGLSQLNPQSIWYKVRKYLIELHGELIDQSWFSKLEAVEEDMTCNRIILKPATDFIGYWIQQKYGRDLWNAFKSHNFAFEFVKADNGARAI